MRPRRLHPFVIPLVILTVSGYALGTTSPALHQLSGLISGTGSHGLSGCGCTDSDCCGASCCAEPEEPILSCCASPIPATATPNIPTWNPACTCGHNAQPGTSASGFDTHLYAAQTCAGVLSTPQQTTADLKLIVHRLTVEPDDPVPKPTADSLLS